MSETVTFTNSTPFIGLYGKQTNTLKALGFYTFTCAPVPSNQTLNTTNSSSNLNVTVNNTTT